MPGALQRYAAGAGRIVSAPPCPRCRAALPPLADLLALDCERCGQRGALPADYAPPRPLPGFEHLVPAHPDPPTIQPAPAGQRPT